METITESLDEEEINIYGDICDFDLGEEIEKVSKQYDRLYSDVT